MFDATLFEATYQDSYTAASISDECYNQSKIKAKEAFDTFNKTQEKWTPRVLHLWPQSQ